MQDADGWLTLCKDRDIGLTQREVLRLPSGVREAEGSGRRGAEQGLTEDMHPLIVPFAVDQAKCTGETGPRSLSQWPNE